MTATAAGPLTQLLDPYPQDRFFREVWERRPLVLSGRPKNAFRHLFSKRAVEALLQRQLHYPFVRLLRDGAAVARRRFTTDYVMPQGVPVKDCIDGRRVAELYRAGATIEIAGLELHWPPVTRFCASLEAEVGCRVDAEAFLSPPNPDESASHPALTPHYDTQDVFILQISGHKRWRIYDSPLELPLNDQLVADLKPGACREEIVLSPGDLVYLPRGTFHEAATMEDHSLHLTIGVWVFRWFDAITAAMSALSDDVRFRKAVPVGALGADAFANGFEEVKRQALDALSAEAAFTALRRSFEISRRPQGD